MKYVCYLFSVGGFIALIFTGINYINESESFSALGVDVAVSKGDPMPVIVSAVILIAGILIIRAAKE
jgi:hypothetical protein